MGNLFSSNNPYNYNYDKYNKDLNLKNILNNSKRFQCNNIKPFNPIDDTETIDMDIMMFPIFSFSHDFSLLSPNDLSPSSSQSQKQNILSDDGSSTIQEILNIVNKDKEIEDIKEEKENNKIDDVKKDNDGFYMNERLLNSLSPSLSLDSIKSFNDSSTSSPINISNDKPIDKPIETTNDKPIDIQINKPIDKPIDKPIEKEKISKEDLLETITSTISKQSGGKCYKKRYQKGGSYNYNICGKINKSNYDNKQVDLNKI